MISKEGEDGASGGGCAARRGTRHLHLDADGGAFAARGISLAILVDGPSLTLGDSRSGSSRRCLSSFYVSCFPRDRHDFVEATVFSRDACVVMTGTFVADVYEAQADAAAPLFVNHVGWWFKPWFYTHVRDVLEVR